MPGSRMKGDNRLLPALIQRMAADECRQRGRPDCDGSPVNGTVEIAGPEQFRLDELVRRDLAARKDPREVITDMHARYYGIQVSERTLVPDDDARFGQTRFDDWLSRATQQTPKGNLQPA